MILLGEFVVSFSLRKKGAYRSKDRYALFFENFFNERVNFSGHTIETQNAVSELAVDVRQQSTRNQQNKYETDSKRSRTDA